MRKNGGEINALTPKNLHHVFMLPRSKEYKNLFSALFSTKYKLNAISVSRVARLIFVFEVTKVLLHNQKVQLLSRSRKRITLKDQNNIY